MMNTAKKIPRKKVQKPILLSILHQAKREHRKREQMFELIGWENLPEELKMEIEADVKGYIEELHGRYSTNCPFVQRRRESVDFWVKSYMDGICTLQTALDALKLKAK